MEDSIVDKILDECSQLRILVVGSSRGKAQLIREIFGVNRVTRYPADFSRDEEIYSKENEYFVAHVFDNWQGVNEVLRRRRRGEPDEVVHCIWHYVDSQDVLQLSGEEEGDQICPQDVRRAGVPIITFFGRFDNIVTRSSEIGKKRRLKQTLTESDLSDAKRIRKIAEAINLYVLQYPQTTAIASKAPSSKLTFLQIMLNALKSRTDLQMLLMIAQRLNPSLKFETAMNLAMKQFLVGTISTASPLPIPFAGLIGSSTASFLIKEDIIKVWNIYDPDYLCAAAQGKSSLMDNLLGLPVYGIKRVVYALPVIAQIKGVWETPRVAKALGGLMIDLTLLMERAFLATMGGIADGSSPLRTPSRVIPISAESPRTPIRPLNKIHLGDRKLKPSPQHHLSPLNPSNTNSPPKPPPRRTSLSLIDLNDTQRPATPPRPATKPKPPVKPPRPTTPATKSPVAHGLQALELSTPTSKGVIDIQIRPSSLPLTNRMLEGIVAEYKPIHDSVAAELDEFFNQEGTGLQRSFQKAVVRRKLDEIVQRYRITQVVDI